MGERRQAESAFIRHERLLKLTERLGRLYHMKGLAEDRESARVLLAAGIADTCFFEVYRAILYILRTRAKYQGTPPVSSLRAEMAEEGGSRTHQARRTRLTGFEVRAPHRGTLLLQALHCANVREPAGRNQIAPTLNRADAGQRVRRAAPVRRVNPARSKYSKSSIVKFRPMPDRSRY